MKYFWLVYFLFVSAIISAQNHLPYAVDLYGQPYSSENLKNVNEEYEQLLLKSNPLLLQHFEEYEQQLQNIIANQSHQLNTQSTIVIPVVFHIVYNTAQQYITDAQVMSQMVVINQDLTRTHPDTVNTPIPFRPIAANPNIQFCLAQRDPQGNPTTGIERRQTTVANFGFNNAVKFYSQGGLDIWDPTRYFNVWVCNTGGTCWGEFPTGTITNTYGAVMHYTMFGSQHTQYGTFANISPYWDRGKIMIHEIGHCFNLRHIWGDDGTSCVGSDTCADTPNQQGPSSFCPTFPQYDSCTTSGNGIMFHNYMDYSDDDCSNILTLGQNARIQAVLSMPPYNALTTSNGCVPVNLFPYDAAITEIIIPDDVVCSTTFSPVIKLQNWGQNTLNSCIITYQVDANPAQTFNWFGNIPSLSSLYVTLNPVTVSTGMHTFTATSSQPNGFADGQTSNDQHITTFSAFNGGASLPQIEGFESTTFVPLNWRLNNPDNGITWVRTTQASKTGVASAKMGNIYYNAIGQKDDMQMFPVNLSSITNPALTFQMAYTYYIFNSQNGPLNFTDTLSVLISTDCGQTFSTLFHKGGAQLSTIAPIPNTTNEFIPTANDWRLETISLTAFQNSTDAIIKFQNKTGWGNALYIDDINILSTSGVDEQTLNVMIDVFPNPTNDVLTIDSKLFSISSIEMVDVLGKTVIQNKSNNGTKLDLNIAELENGIYFLRINTASGMIVKKVVKGN